jgi:hypothetical protein
MSGGAEKSAKGPESPESPETQKPRNPERKHTENTERTGMIVPENDYACPFPVFSCFLGE